MYPVLFQIPLGLLTFVVVGLLFFAGGVVRARFAPAEHDASYLASFLGLNVQWSKVVAPWSKALAGGVQPALVAVGLAVAARYGLGSLLKPGVDGTPSIPLHGYGVMMAIAFLVGIGLATRQAAREGLPPVPVRGADGRQLVGPDGRKAFIAAPELVSDLAFWILVAGLVGSRILYIFTRWQAEYARNPMKVLYVWEGGLVWYGGLIGATAAAFYFIRKHGIPFLPYGDVLIPSVALGHALGRIGCFAAGCCFGNVATEHFPFGVSFPPGSPAYAEHLAEHLLGAGALGSLPVYPTQLLESLGEVLIFGALLLVRSRKRFHGQVVLTYFTLYPLLRFVIEMFRGDKIRAFFFHWPEVGKEMLLSTSQGISIAIALAGFALTLAILRQKNRAAATGAAPAASR
jgi:phosphatidylglycerol:prolipoprotein diacylglycerol transferase